MAERASVIFSDAARPLATLLPMRRVFRPVKSGAVQRNQARAFAIKMRQRIENFVIPVDPNRVVLPATAEHAKKTSSLFAREPTFIIGAASPSQFPKLVDSVLLTECGCQVAHRHSCCRSTQRMRVRSCLPDDP